MTDRMTHATAGDIVVSALAAEGVELAIGIVGSHILGLYEALRKAPGIRHVTAKHETNASLMADAYARISGRMPACITTAGPGALNAIGGVGQAYFQASPMVVIAGAVPTNAAREELHGADDRNFTVNAYANVTKRSFRAPSHEALPGMLAEAFDIARRGRAGPVYVEIPLDIMDADAAPAPAYAPVPPTPPPPCPPELIRDIAARLGKAKRPALCVDKGVIRLGLAAEVTALARAIGATVATSYDAVGAVAGDDALNAGVLSDYFFGSSAFEAVGRADTIVTFGFRQMTENDRFVEQAAGAEVFSFYYDDEPSRGNRGITADLGQVVADLRQAVAAGGRPDAPWFESGEAARRQQNIAEMERRAGEAPVHPGLAAARLCAWVTPETTVSLDAGSNEAWAHLVLPVYEPRSQIGPANWAGMGCALPGMIGARLAAPERRVLGITGDGGLLMALGDLATLVEVGGESVLVVMNDSKFAMIEEFQRERFGALYGTDLSPVDYAAVAESFGAAGFRVERPEELDAAYRAAFEAGRPALVDVVTSPLTPSAAMSYSPPAAA